MLNFSTKEKRTIEEELYSIVVEEIESNILHKPLWAKALVDSNGTDKNTQAFYIQLRVQKLYDEMQEKQQQEDDNIRADKRIENTRIKNENTLATLDTIVVKLLSIFKYLTGIM